MGSQRPLGQILIASRRFSVSTVSTPGSYLALPGEQLLACMPVHVLPLHAREPLRSVRLMPRDFSKEMVQLEGAGAGLFSLAQVSDQVATASLRQSRLGLRPIPVLQRRPWRDAVAAVLVQVSIGACAGQCICRGLFGHGQVAPALV